jgi:citrate lyase subunit beta/citryl-CoA lyase
MIFEDITPFETYTEEELEKLIITPHREKSVVSEPRSAMMLNPLKLKHLNNIDNLDADIVVVNLEDGVAPEMKKRALLLSAVFISHLQKSRSRIIVRVNPVDEGGAEEIKLLNTVKPDSIRVAKIRTPEDVEKVLAILDPDIALHISVETKESLENLSRLNVQNRVECASLGIMDMLNSLGISQDILDLENPTIHYIMSHFLIDCRIAGMYPIGFTYQNYYDTETFRKWCELEKKMGYTAKSCLGPAQVAIANEVFTVLDAEIERAKYIKERFEEMAEEYVSGFMDAQYGFIDEPIYKDALLTLEKFSIK